MANRRPTLPRLSPAPWDPLAWETSRQEPSGYVVADVTRRVFMLTT